MITTYNRNVQAHELPDDITANISLIAVHISELKQYASDLIKYLSDTAWITDLNAVGRNSFERTAERSIDKLVRDFETVDTTINESFGQYMVSLSAGRCLGILLGHTVFPISEIWKEKLVNNPGFDFHTESPAFKISFGEAKYVKNSNPYGQAASQIIDFINDGKDQGDAVFLEQFASRRAIRNLLRYRKGYTVAFSLSSGNHVRILENTLKSDLILEIGRNCDELQIVGVSH